MRIGITGVHGFLGEAVYKKLDELGHLVVSLDSITRKEYLAKRIEESNFTDFDWVLHFGSKTSISDSHNDPFSTYASNISSTLSALKIAEKTNSCFLFMSSFVYGSPQYSPIDEKHPVTSSNPYMSSKIVSEEICTQITKCKNIPLIILRGFNIYGEKLIPGRLISDLLIAKNNYEYITINDPKPKRDYLYIKDFITLLEKIVYTDEIIEGIFNVGSGQSHSNREIVNIFNSLTERPVEVITNTQPRPNDILECVADASKAIEAFTWKPHYTLEQGISEVIMEMETLNVEDL